MRKAIKDGIKSGFKVVWDLGKIIVPTIFIMTFLKYTPLFQQIADFLQPTMSVFGLPGEAAFAIVLGMFISMYSAIGIILTLTLTPVQITTIAAMILTCHGWILEAAVIRKLDVSVVKIFTLRFITALTLGYTISVMM